jgi:hypothetical protein
MKLFAEKLFGQHSYGNLLLRFRAHAGAHGAMHRRARYAGDVGDLPDG